MSGYFFSFHFFFLLGTWIVFLDSFQETSSNISKNIDKLIDTPYCVLGRKRKKKCEISKINIFHTLINTHTSSIHPSNVRFLSSVGVCFLKQNQYTTNKTATRIMMNMRTIKYWQYGVSACVGGQGVGVTIIV